MKRSEIYQSLIISIVNRSLLSRFTFLLTTCLIGYLSSVYIFKVDTIIEIVSAIVSYGICFHFFVILGETDKDKKDKLTYNADIKKYWNLLKQ